VPIEKRRRRAFLQARRRFFMSRLRVSRILFPSTSSGQAFDKRRRRSFLFADCYQSARAFAGPATYPRSLDRPGPGLFAYLVLLPVGFAMPFVSPRTRCALTAPFHPYPKPRMYMRGFKAVSFCCTFRRITPPGRYPAPCPVQFGLSSPAKGYPDTSAIATEPATNHTIPHG